MKPVHRICSTCKEAKSLEQFTKTSWQCKLCRADYDAERRRVCQQFVWDSLANSAGCQACGERHPAKLAHDHLDQADKLHCISNMAGRGKPIAEIQKEMDKCVILCHNCHCIRTAKQMGWYRNLDTKGWF